MATVTKKDLARVVAGNMTRRAAELIEHSPKDAELIAIVGDVVRLLGW